MWVEVIWSVAAIVGLIGYFLIRNSVIPARLLLERALVATGGIVSGKDELQSGGAVQQLKLVITADAGCHSRDIARCIRSRAVLVRQLPLPVPGGDLMERSTMGHTGLDEQRAVLTVNLSDIPSVYPMDSRGQYAPPPPVPVDVHQPFSLLTLSAQCPVAVPVSSLADYLDAAATDIESGLNAGARIERGCGYRFRLAPAHQPEH
ncbi:hypothetical protein I7V28_19095 [Lelliottia amnigena]|uniref:hypothetical protein n=1 Tax=Lelliottia TaxID=1330545 RepID=UPI00192ABEAD|nr:MULTISPECIES: hypothetical protein [Lelliottia]MBL5885617.1 hypothetical protein [Lelliottia aquatilis]MBL5923189.1 hypothetical protein [Lelliottia amnigena]MBL5932105.1 hypothetical protein [Lelliottia amnigena]